MSAIELPSDVEVIQCGNGAAAAKSGSHSGQRSAGGGAAVAEAKSNDSGSSFRGPNGELDTPENLAKMEGKMKEKADAFLNGVGKVDGIDQFIPDLLNKPNNDPNGPGSGISSRIIRLADMATGGEKFGSKKNANTTITPSAFAESLQTIANPSVNTPMATLGRHVSSKAYDRLSSSGKQRVAYEITRGFYRMDQKYIDTLPKGMRDDLTKRVNRIRDGVNRVFESQGVRNRF